MTSNVTFIIGNGFDLGLGLMTSYRDFYSYVKAKKLHPNNKIYQAISNDPDTWADFELSLGTYTQYIEDEPEKDKVKASLAFHDDLEEITQDLADYLEQQESKIDDAVSDVKLARNNFFEELPVGQKNRISSLVSTRTINFNFVSLNYTSTLEKAFPNRNRVVMPANTQVNIIHHIHGDLSENVTLGVSDESQLSSALTGNEKDDLIKPRLIESMNDGRIEDMKRLVKGSSIIVLFGTSIGETDRYIWNYLVDWLWADPARHIVIHKHDKNYTDAIKRIQRRKKLFIGEVQNRLLSNTKFDDDQKTALRSRIFVIHNSKKLFFN